MDEDRIDRKALLRYQIISAFLAQDPPRGERYKLLEELAGKQWLLEDGKILNVHPETIRYWVRLYRTGGFEALKDTPRQDRGVRSIPGSLIEEACRLKQEVPERSIEQIILIMEQMGKASAGLVARSTLHRALRARGLSARRLKSAGDQNLGRFQADYANDLWQADMLTGPWLPDPDRPDKHRRAYLYAFLDDASRLVLYGRFFFKGDLPALELVMKRAIQRYGKPRKTYYDNAMVFRSHKMTQICAALGMHKIVFTTPYRPEGHGKIEAFNRFCRARFIAELKASSIRTLKDLNEAFLAWLDEHYNKRKHSELGMSPLERWLRDADRIQYVDEQKLTRAFLFQLDRTTDKCAVFKLHGRSYQCGWELAKKKIQVHYDPEQLDLVEVFRHARFVQRAKPLTVTAHRPPKRHPAPVLAGQHADPHSTDWLGFLVQKRRLSLPAACAPEPDRDLAACAFDADTDAFVALLKHRLAEEIFDEQAVRNFWSRFGPLDLAQTEQRLDQILSIHPANQHIGFYLEALREQGDQP